MACKTSLPGCTKDLEVNWCYRT